MSERFYSERFQKYVWLTNHAIEAMAKRRVTLPELKALLALAMGGFIINCLDVMIIWFVPLLLLVNRLL